MKRRKTRGRKRPANKVEPFGYDPLNPITLYYNRVGATLATNRVGATTPQKNIPKKIQYKN